MMTVTVTVTVTVTTAVIGMEGYLWEDEGLEELFVSCALHVCVGERESYTDKTGLGRETNAITAS